MRQLFSKLVVSCLILLTFISISNGQTTVNPGANTLSDAIAAASAGDVLVLSGGEYTESIQLVITKNLTIKAADGLIEKPVLKTAAEKRFIELHSDLILEGLDFDGQTAIGKAIYNKPPDFNDLKITDCIFHDFDDGGGDARVIHVNDSNFGFNSLIIDDCVFENIGLNGEDGNCLYLERDNEVASMTGVKYLTITNSTFHHSTRYCIGIVEGYPEINTTDLATFIIDHVTLANCLVKQAISFKSMTGSISNSIIAHIGGAAIKVQTASYVYIDHSNLFNLNLAIDEGIYFLYTADSEVVEEGGMLFEDPIFADTTNANGDYTLDASSPLLTADSDGGAMGDPRWDPNAVGIPEETNSTIPKKFALSQNYPNPFNPVTKIEFDLPESGMVRLNVYNILGHKVSELVNRELTAGQYNYSFEAANLPSGVYVYRLETKNYNQTRKMILMK